MKRSVVTALVAETILRYNMLPRGSRIGIAVSGGADSIGLLALLAELAPARDWHLTVLHFDHGLRGAESDADAAFVRQAASRAGLPCLTGRVRRGLLVPPNLEEKARQARYAFFARMAVKHRLDRVATAHTLNDQAETVLLRLLRGAGPSGLAGIAPVMDSGALVVVRPLIELQRPELEAWLRGRDLSWREDSSNADLSFDRNRVRHQLMPLLQGSFNPAITRVLGRVTELFAAEEQFWTAWTLRALAAATLRRTTAPGQLVLATTAVASLGLAEQRRLLRGAIEAVKGDLRQCDQAHIARLAALCKSGRGTGSVQLPGLTATRSFDQLLLATPEAMAALAAVKPFSIAVRQAGRWLAIPGGGGRLRIRRPPAGSSTGYNTDAGSVSSSGGPPWVVRNWQPGDAYRPTGYQRPRKVKDLFQDARIPWWERSGWPIIIGEASRQIVWARRFGLADGVGPALIVEEGE